MSLPDSSTRPTLAIDFEPFICPGDPLQLFLAQDWPLDRPPHTGAFEYLESLLEHFEVDVCSWRNPHYEYRCWWKRYGWPMKEDMRPERLNLVPWPGWRTFLYLSARTHTGKPPMPSPLELTKFSPYSPEVGTEGRAL
jgi:hypothetical protein